MIDLIKKEGLGEEVQQAYEEIKTATMITGRLAFMRQAAGITQEEMAEHLGITQSAISKLEAGRDECPAPRFFVGTGQVQRRIIWLELARGVRGNLTPGSFEFFTVESV